MDAAMIEAAAQVFTLAEIEAMADFFGAEVGAAILGKMLPVNQLYLEAIGPDLQRMQMAILGRVSRELAQ